MTDQGRLLLGAIKADPADDLARLAYADWLDEQGLDAPACIVRERTQKYADHVTTFSCPTGRHWCVDRRTNDRGGYMPGSWADWIVRSLPPPREGMICVVRRGLIEQVRCTLQDWLESGPALADAQPVTKLILTDRQPLKVGAARTWYKWLRELEGGDVLAVHALPLDVYRRVGVAPGGRERLYDSEEQAYAALIGWARWKSEQK